MKLTDFVEDCEDYDWTDKQQSKYGDWAIIGLLDEIARLDRKVKRLKEKCFKCGVKKE